MKAEWTNSDSLTTSQTTKAILVFETDDDISKLHADIYKEDEKGNGEIVLSYLPLRPMPQKMRTDADDIEEDSYWQGWNDCLDAITGETE